MFFGPIQSFLLLLPWTQVPPQVNAPVRTYRRDVALSKTASRILAALNKDVEPCQDFYEFACGGWIKKNPVPEWATSWDQLAKLREQLVVDLRELLEAEDEEGLPDSVLKAKALYRTCVNIGESLYNCWVKLLFIIAD